MRTTVLIDRFRNFLKHDAYEPCIRLLDCHKHKIPIYLFDKLFYELVETTNCIDEFYDFDDATKYVYLCMLQEYVERNNLI